MAYTVNQNIKVLFIGDSTTVGVGADPTGLSDVNGSRPFSVPLKAKDWLVDNGIESIAESLAGDNAVGVLAWNDYRPDVTATSLSTSSRSPTAGGFLPRHNTSSLLELYTSDDVDTVEFAYPRTTGFGVLQLSIDGVDDSTYNQDVSPEDYFLSESGGMALGRKRLQFSRFSGTPHGPGYINAWNSNKKSIQIINAGARNSGYTEWNKTTYPASALNAIGTIAPNIAVIDLGINDYRTSGATIAQVTAGIQLIIDECESAGAIVILVVPNPIATYSTVTDTWSQAAVLSMYEGLQASNPTAKLVDAPAVYYEAGLTASNPATYTELDAGGHMYDFLHPKASVYEAEGFAVGEVIKQVSEEQGWISAPPSGGGMTAAMISGMVNGMVTKTIN